MININTILVDKVRMLYNVLLGLGQSTFSELKEKTNLTDVDLCMALCGLLKLNKIYQRKVDNEIIYGIA